jgi:outer membrane lipoprotein LolB
MLTGHCRASRRASLVLLTCALLASCSAPRLLRPDAARMKALEQREDTLRSRPDWTLRGRMAISGPEDSGSGTLDWSQQGPAFRFTLSAPVSGKTWTLSGDGQHAELLGLHGQQAVVAATASGLLASELGWNVPVAQLAYWVRGIRAPGPADVVFQGDGLPAEIRQDGWVIEFRDYETTRDPLLPRKIFAGNGAYKVRLVVQSWELQ